MDIAELRKAIDDADEIILRALAARFEGAKQLKQIKDEQKISIEDTAREDEIKKRWKKRAEELGIRQELALLILDFLISESKRLQAE